MSDIESTSPKPADSGALLGTLLSNPDLIRNISAMLGKSGDGATEEASPQPTNLPPLGNNEAVTDLFKMTPYYYKTGAKDHAKLASLSSLSTEIAFHLCIYKKIVP